MELLDYIKKFDATGLRELAERCQTSAGHLKNVAYGYKPCGIALAVALEAESKGAVSRARLRKHDYWLIWPDLKAPAEVQS